MSEPQIPIEPDTVTPQPVPQTEAAHEQAVELDVAQPTKPRTTRTKPIPDWRPLGTIRDYFAEQIRQDNFGKY